MSELLDMIKTLKNTNINQIDKTKEKQINKKIKKIEKFINNPELKPEPKKKTKTINKNEEDKPKIKDNGMAEMMRIIDKEMKEKGVIIQERKKKGKPKKKISDNDDDSSEDEEYLKNVEHNKRLAMMEKAKAEAEKQKNEDNSDINKNIKLVDSQAFIENTKEQLNKAGQELTKLQNKLKITDKEFIEFVDKYLKVPNITVKDKKKINLLKEKLNLK
jgi:hypothetical protein